MTSPEQDKVILVATEAIEDALEYWNGWIDGLGLAETALDAAAPLIIAAERKRIIGELARGYRALDEQTQATLAGLMVRWAAAITDDPELLAEIADLQDTP